MIQRYSADPRVVKEAQVLPSMSYMEAWEMAYFGANARAGGRFHAAGALWMVCYGVTGALLSVFGCLGRLGSGFGPYALCRGRRIVRPAVQTALRLLRG